MNFTFYQKKSLDMETKVAIKGLLCVSESACNTQRLSSKAVIKDMSLSRHTVQTTLLCFLHVERSRESYVNIFRNLRRSYLYTHIQYQQPPPNLLCS